MPDPRHIIVAHDTHELSGPDWRWTITDTSEGHTVLRSLAAGGYTSAAAAQEQSDLLNSADDLLARVDAFREGADAAECGFGLDDGEDA